MKSLIILIPAGQNNLSSVIGPYKFFLKANEYMEFTGREPVFKVQLAGVNKQLDLYDGVFSIRPHLHIKDVKKTDLLIIPAQAYSGLEHTISINKQCIEFIKEQHHLGAEVASICTGAFLLAATGLMEGKQCSTHWKASSKFHRMFPEVILQTDKILTDEGGIYTNGGAFSFLNLLLYLVEKYYGRETAIFCAKIFQVDMDRDSQSQFTIFNGQKDHTDDIVMKAQEMIEKNIMERFSMDRLADILALSRRNFDRRFFRATGNTPLEYQQRVKIETAKKLLESGHKTVSEVMYEVGYLDIKAFRELFRKLTGLTPLDYRKRYNKDAELISADTTPD